ncbi:MAG TPA: hypothetical protein VNG51_17970 [Ktedonobacteraceae bacterium]|nr:hypothetical protein [Ktedonobacteraceae bacterium]
MFNEGDGIASHGLDQKCVYAPTDAEFQRYCELLGGFFEKFTRWQEILQVKGKKDYEWLELSILRSGNDFSIVPGTSVAKDDLPNKILELRQRIDYSDPDIGHFGASFFIRPGSAGEQLLTDQEDETPLESVKIKVGTQPPVWKGIKVETERPAENPKVVRDYHYNYRAASYDFWGNTLKVSHQYPHPLYGVMTDGMATSLINTIDALIPKVTPVSQQAR